MGLLTLFCVVTVTGLTSGAGVLPEDPEPVAVGGSVTFTTSLTPSDTPASSITWVFGVRSILVSISGITTIQPEYEGRVTVDVFTGSLELRNLSLSDSGAYSVTIIQTAGDSIRDGSTTLKVDEPVSNVGITSTGTDLVEFNDTVSLSCSANGSSPSFLWFKDNIQLTATDRVLFTDGNKTVTIDPVRRSDHGRYSCEVSNPVSEPLRSIEILLSVSYGPEDVTVTRSPPAEHYAEGSDVSLSCSADSTPAAQFQWLFNGEMLGLTGEKLDRPDIQMEQSGNYSCQAFNSRTLRYANSEPATVSVWKRITDMSVNSSSSQPVEGKEAVNLTCAASGSILTIVWKFNEIEIKPSANIVFYNERRVLSIRVPTRDDTGNYTCIISNPISSQSVYYMMTVNYGAENVQISDPGKVFVGKTLTLSCSADSVPTALYTWTKNGEILSETQEYSKTKIKQSDSGEYVCRATNEITMKHSEASRTVQVTVDPCPVGCIVGIVIGCIAVILLIAGAVFFVLKKKKQKAKSTTRTDGEGQDNSAYAQNQEVNYAEVRFVKKDGSVVPLGVQDNSPYAEVRKTPGAPVSHLPTYDAHMQRVKKPAPMPPSEYAQVRPK